jgi:hypothetical protein
MTGRIQTAGGQPDSAHETDEVSLRASTSGVVADCDVRVAVTLRFEGP